MLCLFPLACLNIVFLQRDRARLVVDFLVETTSIADNITASCSSPESCLGCLTISTGGAFSPTR